MSDDNIVPRRALKASSAASFLFALWVFFSPWMFHVQTHDAWNAWLLGGLVALFSVIRYVRPAHGRTLSALCALFGLWIFFSPWVYGYTGEALRFAASSLAGIGILGANALGTVTVSPPKIHPPAART